MTTTNPPCPYSSVAERFNPLAGDQLENPQAFYAEARRDEPVFFSEMFGMWIVTRYADVRTVLSTPAIYSSRDSIKAIVEPCPEAQAVLDKGFPTAATVVDTDGAAHTRWRKVMSTGFAAPRMRLMEPDIWELTRDRVDALAPLGRPEVLGDIAFPIPLQVIARLCDIGDEHLDDLKRWGQSYLRLISSVMEPADQVEAAQDFVDYQRFMHAHIERKRSAPGDDITSALIAADDVPFSEGELVRGMLNMFLAGHETTAYMVGNALYYLLREPEHWQAIVADRSLIPAAVEETLRIDAPVPTFRRTATTDTELAGKKIAKGDDVLVVFASANHDAAEFTEPERFDLHRSGRTPHLSFGHGVHFCVGAPLARIEGRVILETLADRLPGLRLVPGQALRHIPQLIFHAFEKLDVEWG